MLMDRFSVQSFFIQGPLLITPKIFRDERGFFTERYRSAEFQELGISESVQENYSQSQARVLRGLHYQFNKPQSKMVTATRGKILDIAVDLRRSSKTLGQHIAVELDGSLPQWFFIPAGFAHGFCVISDEGADVLYKIDQIYNASGEASLRWDDSDLKIRWPIQKPLLSTKDQIAPSFSDYLRNPHF